MWVYDLFALQKKILAKTINTSNQLHCNIACPCDLPFPESSLIKWHLVSTELSKSVSI